jgi:hypothetical protein
MRAGHPDLRDHHPGSPGAPGLAGGPPDHARGDGEHRGVLEAGLLRARRGVHRLLGQPRPHQAGPGRKTDAPRGHPDCAWIAPRLECGLLRGSFVPPAAIRELRDLTRDLEGPHPRPNPGGQPPPQGPGGRGAQARHRGERCPRRLRPGHADRPSRGDHGPHASSPTSPAAACGGSSRPSARPSSGASGATTRSS